MAAATQSDALRQRKLMQPVGDELSVMLSHDGQQYCNFSGNDYLGLASSQSLKQAAKDAADAYGVGAMASPLVTGYSQAHQQLEQLLCETTGHEAALLFCSGFSANSALMQTLFDREDYLICDRLVHASIIDGLLHSKAKFGRFKHNDVAHAAHLTAKQLPSAIVTESVFSMDGDSAPIDALNKLAKQANCWLIVDDAHGFGIHHDADPAKESAGEQQTLNAPILALTHQQCDVQIVTFGKALGCQGAAILGRQLLIDYLVANARHYIYSTALSPLNAHIAYNAVKLSLTATSRRQQLHRNIALFKQCCQHRQVSLVASNSPIQPIIVGGNRQVIQLADKLKQQGFIVGAIRPPTVPKGSARLRVTLSALHSAEQITKLVDVIAAELAQIAQQPVTD